jgi:hypothetical protein
MPWAKPMFDGDGNLLAVRCKMCTKIKHKQKLLIPKWDFLKNVFGKIRMKKGLK